VRSHHVAIRAENAMRVGLTMPLLMLIAMSGCTQPVRADESPASAAKRNEAGWADWEAQARISDGDYDGAVQAEQQAVAETGAR
jgi:hypothetical protein